MYKEDVLAIKKTQKEDIKIIKMERAKRIVNTTIIGEGKSGVILIGQKEI